VITEGVTKAVNELNLSIWIESDLARLAIPRGANGKAAERGELE
jgi:hypothetical protein